VITAEGIYPLAVQNLFKSHRLLSRNSQVTPSRSILLSVFKVLLVCAVLCVLIPTLRLTAQTDTPSLSKAQWHEDLKFLADQLLKRHANAFHFLPKAAFVHEVSQLDRALDELNRDEIFVGMDRIENSIGDGHSYIRIPAEAPIFPVHFERFGENYRLVSTRDIPGARSALGGRLLKINNLQINRAQRLLLTLTPADETQSLRDVRATALLNDGMALHGLGITPTRDRVRYVVLTSAGTQVMLEYNGEFNQFPGAATTDILKIGWLRVVAHPALYLQQPDQDFWCTFLPATRTGYCNFRSYKDLRHTSLALKDLMKQKQPRQSGG
jgi:hypothetical protein